LSMQRIGLIMAGGASRRMGSDKLALPHHPGGDSILAHVTQSVLTEADAVWLLVPSGSTGEGRRVAERVGGRARLCVDDMPHQGPLRALAHAWPRVLAELPQAPAAVWVVAGDLPGIRPSVLTRLADVLLADSQADAALVCREGRLQPLLGCYRPRAGDVFVRAAAAGEVRLAPAVAELRVVTVAAEAAGWPDWCVRPVHTPDDYEAWLAWWRETQEQEEKTDAS
jgi:molybdopterin-guanine dinucleotide biosynthesis protein A